MSEDLIVLPSAEVMTASLRTVIDEPHAVQYLYPKIARHAGQRKAPEGVELLVMLEIYDYASEYPAAVADTLQVAVPAFVQALIGASTAAAVPGEGCGTGNRGASYSNGPAGPRWPAELPRPVTHWDFTEGRLPE